MADTLDLAIIGGGPAGLSAAINASSEGLKVCLLDADLLGGQARESRAIENYPGFPLVTGQDLMQRLIEQALKFKTPIQPMTRVQRLNRDKAWLVCTCDNGEEWACAAVLLSMGVSYRRFIVPGVGAFLGNGVYYGLAPGFKPPSRPCTTVIVGGANSAGQAAVHLASHGANSTVKVVVRRTLADAMSQYLIDRLNAMANVEVIEGAEVAEIYGNGKLEGVKLSTDRAVPCHMVNVFIGAEPKTAWLRDSGVRLNDRGFITTTDFETQMPGVFAAGDVRLGSVKRVAAAVGEGAAAISTIHGYLDKLAP
jgi:thioredoxin reductase (NADPH)